MRQNLTLTQDGLRLLGLSNPPASDSQLASSWDCRFAPPVGTILYFCLFNAGLFRVALADFELWFLPQGLGLKACATTSSWEQFLSIEIVGQQIPQSFPVQLWLS